MLPFKISPSFQVISKESFEKLPYYESQIKAQAEIHNLGVYAALKKRIPLSESKKIEFSLVENTSKYKTIVKTPSFVSVIDTVLDDSKRRLRPNSFYFNCMMLWMKLRYEPLFFVN